MPRGAAVIKHQVLFATLAFTLPHPRDIAFLSSGSGGGGRVISVIVDRAHTGFRSPRDTR